MPNRIAKIFCLFPLGLVAGCLPFYALVDYTPEMPGAKVNIGHCLGYKTVEYETEGVTVRANINIHPRMPEDEPKVRLGFTVPEGKVVELLSAEIIASSPLAPGSVQIRIASFTTTSSFGKESVDPLKPLKGGVFRISNFSYPQQFSTALPLSALPIGDYRVELPDMKVNGKVAKIPAVTFKRTPRLEFLVPVNC